MSGNPEIDGLVGRLADLHGNEPTALLQVLRGVQKQNNWISPQAADLVADRLGVRRVDVDALVEFYAFLSDRPRGEFDIRISDNIVDQMAGSRTLLERLCSGFGIEPGVTRADGRVSVDTCSCIGMSDQGPAALVNGRTITRITAERAAALIDLVERQEPMEQWPSEFFQVDDNIRRGQTLLHPDFAIGAALHWAKQRGSEDVLVEMMGSGLRGLGGAGFRTSEKWLICRNTEATERYVVCNADEGEPGTFKDRVLLQSFADQVFEGMTLCAKVIGARKGFLYLRAEYEYLVPSLQDTLQCRRSSSLLGGCILGEHGFDFDIEIHLGAGAYICGEESALIESLEGKRGIPRIRPPYPVTRGYLGKPTVVNNVETFAAAARIAVYGGDCHAQVGTANSKGTKLLSVSGDCERPGIYEYPWGVTVQQVLRDCGGEQAIAVQVAGPAGHLLSRKQFFLHLAYEELATGGSFMVFGPERDLLDVVANFTAFFKHESCGFCTPCRVGTSLLDDLINKARAGHATRRDLDEMAALADLLRDASHCGLGNTAGNPVRDSLEGFAETYRTRLASDDFQPSFDLEQSLGEARVLTGRG